MEKFSAEQEAQIKRNPEFRTKFAHLCNELGIDPLVSFLNSQTGSLEYVLGFL